MYTLSQLALAGVGISILGAFSGLVLGLPGALRWGRNAFFSLGMSMFFLAWLQLINFDGSWPTDQPPDKQFRLNRTKADEKRIWDAMGAIETMTKQDWDDYHRCNDLNICVRRLQGQRTMLPSDSAPPPASPTTTETRCVVLDGKLRCNEYIRR